MGWTVETVSAVEAEIKALPVKLSARLVRGGTGGSGEVDLPRSHCRQTHAALSDVASHSAVASGGVLDAGAGEPLVGRQGPVNAPSMRATRSAMACKSRRNSPNSATTRPCKVRISGTSTASRATPTPAMAIASALTGSPSPTGVAASSRESPHSRCRREDETVRRLIDCLIAAVTIGAGVAVLHRDDDFDVLARDIVRWRTGVPGSAACVDRRVHIGRSGTAPGCVGRARTSSPLSRALAAGGLRCLLNGSQCWPLASPSVSPPLLPATTSAPWVFAAVVAGFRRLNDRNRRGP